jgi:23S rRNA (guanosine2251-2'-O)-methyltransferase
MRRDREKIYLYGKHALMEALVHMPHVIKKAFLSAEAAQDGALRGLLAKAGVSATMMKRGEADRMVGEDTAHQGVIAVADPEAIVVDFKSFVANLTPTEETMLVILDELTDPHNVGAIIRSAAAFGAAGVLTPSHHQARITGAVVKTSAGMVFRVPIVGIGNVNQSVDVLQRLGFRAYALATHGTVSVADEPFDGPSLIVVGNEAKGIRQKTFERADVGLRIPMDPRCESLNASVSAAVVLYQWSVRHSKALKAIGHRP